MDKYEYTVKSDKIKQLIERKDYAAAANIAADIDWSRVQDIRTLMMAAEAFEKDGQYDNARDVLLAAYDLVPVGKGMLYKLSEISLKQNKIWEAKRYYEEYARIAPKDAARYELCYKIACARKEPINRRIEILEQFRRHDMDEKLFYELARLYHEAGRGRDCVAMCDDIELWFGEGEYVEAARELKANYSSAIAEARKKQQEEAEIRRLRIEELENEIKADNNHTDEGNADEYQDELKEQPIEDDIQEALAEQFLEDEDIGPTVNDIEEYIDHEPESADEEDGLKETDVNGSGIKEDTEEETKEDTADAEEIDLTEFINAGSAGNDAPDVDVLPWMGESESEDTDMGRKIWEGLEKVEKNQAFKPDPSTEAESEEDKEEIFNMEEAVERNVSAEDFSRNLEAALKEEVAAFEKTEEQDEIDKNDLSAEEEVFTDEENEYETETKKGESFSVMSEEGINGMIFPEVKKELDPSLAEHLYCAEDFDEQGFAVSGSARFAEKAAYYKPVHSERRQTAADAPKSETAVNEEYAAINEEIKTKPEEDFVEENELTPKLVCLLSETAEAENAIRIAMNLISDARASMGLTETKMVKITADKMNARGMKACVERLDGRDLIVLGADDLNETLLDELTAELNFPSISGIIVLTDTPERMNELTARRPELKDAGVSPEKEEPASAEQEREFSLDEQMAQAFGEFESENKTFISEVSRMTGEFNESEFTDESLSGDADFVSDEDAAGAMAEEDDYDASESMYEYVPENFTEDDDDPYEAVRKFTRYAEKYADSLDCVLDETAILAINVCAEDLLNDGKDLNTDVAHELVDNAVDLAERPSLRGVFSKKYDKRGRLILREQHFGI